MKHSLKRLLTASALLVHSCFVPNFIQAQTPGDNLSDQNSSRNLIDFDLNTPTINAFNGLTFNIIPNPELSGSNDVASNVGEVINSGINNFEGLATGVLNPFNFSTNSAKTITVDVFSSIPVNVDLQVKAINAEGATQEIPRGASKAVFHNGTGWEKLTFDYTQGAIKSFDGFGDDGEAFIPEGNYNQMVMLIDPGAPAPNGAATYYVDNFDFFDTNSNGNQAPTVSISGIENGQIFTEGDNFIITANVNDVDGEVTLVEFFNGTEKIGEDLEAPFTLEVSNASVGTFNYSAVATDNEQASTASNTIEVIVETDLSEILIDFDNLNPIISPFNGLVFNVISNPNLSGSNAISTNVGEVINSGVNNFEGLATSLLSTLNFNAESSKTITVDVFSSIPVNVDLQVKASNAEGITLENPRGASKAVAHSGTGWEKLVFDYNSGAIKSFDGFSDDGQGFIPEGVFNQFVMLIDPGAPSPNGAATYYVDNFKLVVNPTDNVPNIAPTVRIPNITNGRMYNQGDIITIIADAQDTDGTVSKVEFFNGEVKIGEDTETPFVLELENALVGNYEFKAIATDNDGDSQTSATVMAMVNEFTPPANQQLSFVEKHGRLQVSGNRVVDKNNQEVSLAGNSLFWSIAGDTSDFYNADAINHISSSWNSAIVRAAMGVQEDDSFDNGRGFIEDPEYQKQKIRRVIDAAIAQGIYVIIDWHSHEAELYTAEAAAFFKEMASIYGAYPNVIYEIYNEPIEQTWPTIKQYAETVIEAIRSEDPDNLVIVGTSFFSQEVDVASEDPIEDANVAYTLHFYAGTHGQSLRNRAVTALSNGVALFVTEWGAVEASGDGGIAYEETLRWLDFLRENNISHASWSLSDKPSNTNPSIIEGSAKILLNGGVAGLQNNQLSEYGFFTKNIIQNWTGFKSSNDTADGLRTILNFDNITTTLNPFNGLTTAIVTNPNLEGVNNTESLVGEIINSGVTNFEGFSTGVLAPIDFGPNSTKILFVDVYSTIPVNVDLQVKATNEFGTVIQTPRGASRVVGHTGTGWETLEFNYNEFANKSFDGFPDDGEPNFVPEGLFNQLTMLIDGGAPAPNGAATYYVDNFRLKLPEPAPVNQLPQVSIVGLENGAVFTEGDTILLSAEANDADGEITSVAFFNGNEKIGEVFSAPFTLTLENAIIGNYQFTAVATDNNDASTTSTIVQIEVIEKACTFGAPSPNSLPEIKRGTYTEVHVFGNNGPDVTNFRRFKIRWIPRVNGLFLFATNTENGRPNFFINLRNKVSHNFNQPNPDITITNSGLEGWDGSYWVILDGDNFVMVSKDRGFTLYFNKGEAPECSDQASAENSNGASSLNENKKIFNLKNPFIIFPNPANDILNIQNLNGEINSYIIIDINGKALLNGTITTSETAVDISALPKGIYFVKIENTTDITKRIPFLKK